MQRMYLVWVDVNGFTRLTLINTTTGAATIMTDLVAVSNADWLNLNETGFTVNGAPSPTAATFQRVSDSAMLLFQTGAGQQIKLQLPAPQLGIFQADTVTVNSAAITTLIADCIGVLATPTGTPAVAFVAGLRQPTTRENYQ
jgi:hypothetical protein